MDVSTTVSIQMVDFTVLVILAMHSVTTRKVVAVCYLIV